MTACSSPSGLSGPWPSGSLSSMYIVSSNGHLSTPGPGLLIPSVTVVAIRVRVELSIGIRTVSMLYMDARIVPFFICCSSFSSIPPLAVFVRLRSSRSFLPSLLSGPAHWSGCRIPAPASPPSAPVGGHLDVVQEALASERDHVLFYLLGGLGSAGLHDVLRGDPRPGVRPSHQVVHMPHHHQLGDGGLVRSPVPAGSGPRRQFGYFGRGPAGSSGYFFLRQALVHHPRGPVFPFALVPVAHLSGLPVRLVVWTPFPGGRVPPARVCPAGAGA